MTQMLNFSEWAFVFSLLAAILVIPLFVLARPGLPMSPLFGYIVLMLALGGAIGALGRLVDADPFLDYWIRILVIATRITVIGAMLHDINWFWKRRAKKA